MKNTLRCCISCILPCGSLDVIRIVHVNGRVEDITGTVRAAEIMELHPKHVLKKPTTAVVPPAIVVVPPDAHLQRGKIYFLIPVVDPTPSKKARSSSSTTARRKQSINMDQDSGSGCNKSISVRANLVFSEQYLSEIMNEKISSQRERRRGRVTVWRPRLESITETLTDSASIDRS